VNKDQRACVQFQRPLDHLTRVDRDMVDGAAGLRLIRDQHVLAVQKQHAKLLDLAMRHGGVAIVQKRVPGSQNRLSDHPRPHHSLCRSLDQLEFKDHGRTCPPYQRQTRHRGGYHPIEIPERVQQKPRQRFDILTWDRAKQHQFQKFIVRHRRSAALHEAVAQPLPVVRDVGWQTPRQGCRRGLILIARGRCERQQGFMKGLCHAPILPGHG